MKTESPAVYEWTGPTGVKFRDVKEPSGTYYHDTTPRLVIDALETASTTRSRVRIFYGDRVTGKCWHDEHMVCGVVGRSTGPIRKSILIPSSRSMGGSAILTDCVVRLLVDGLEVYKHPIFDNGAFLVKETTDGELKGKGYTHSVDIDGKNFANFKSFAKASRWTKFMLGERMSK